MGYSSILDYLVRLGEVMNRFNFFIAGSVVASLLSSVGNVGLCASSEYSKATRDSGIDWKFVGKEPKIEDKVSKKEKSEQSTFVGKALASFVSAMLGAGAGVVGTRIYRIWKNNEIQVYVGSYFSHCDEKYQSAYKVFDLNGDTLAIFPTLSQCYDFIFKNGFRIVNYFHADFNRFSIDGSATTDDIGKLRGISDIEWEKMYGRYFSRRGKEELEL